jgi:Fur family ferric uptake transcriptional regulator
MTPSDDHGFTIDETEVIHWGLCPDCAQAPSSDTSLSNGKQRKD